MHRVLGFWEGSKNKNRYRITKLILGTGFWDSGKAAKTKIDIALLRHTYFKLTIHFVY
jgi:hypothetical protein